MQTLRHDPQIAALLWNLNSGTERFNSLGKVNLLHPSDPCYSDLKCTLQKQIENEQLTLQEKHQLTNEYFEAMGRGGYGNNDADSRLLTCPCCGVRDLDAPSASTSFVKVNLCKDFSSEQLGLLHLTREQVKKQTDERNLPPLPLPCDASAHYQGIRFVHVTK